MAAIQFRQRRVRRWWYLGMTAATAAALAVLFVGGAGASLPGSTFGGGDGNLTCNDANGALDWNCLSTSGSPQLHIGTEQFTGQNDNSFGRGTKENDANVIGNSPQGFADPVQVTANGLKPGTYNGTIEIARKLRETEAKKGNERAAKRPPSH